MMKLKDFLKKQGCEKNLAELLGVAIPNSVKLIRESISKQGGELAGSQNASGEKQLALDVQSNQIVVDELQKSGLTESMASEELEGLVEGKKGAPFTVVFDPLDGSSLVDVNFAVGSIFGIYPAGNLIGRTGEDQLAACFAVYGPHTTLVITFKKGTHEFRLNNKDGEFYLTKENLKIAPESKYFAPGNLRAAAENEKYLKLTNDYIKRGLTLRYSGGMVPDINHILLKGSGIFTYPGYSKAPNGKLRLLFECNPMSFIAEQAGGQSTDGHVRILDKKITELHQRTPIFIGSQTEVSKLPELLGGKVRETYNWLIEFEVNCRKSRS
ncbi:MAG: class 1 fructose-bisphosphatase [Candidatus Gracilibacteria bacterium]